jgi:hypothetical protein
MSGDYSQLQNEGDDRTLRWDQPSCLGAIPLQNPSDHVLRPRQLHSRGECKVSCVSKGKDFAPFLTKPKSFCLSIGNATNLLPRKVQKKVLRSCNHRATTACERNQLLFAFSLGVLMVHPRKKNGNGKPDKIWERKGQNGMSFYFKLKMSTFRRCTVFVLR